MDAKIKAQDDYLTALINSNEGQGQNGGEKLNLKTLVYQKYQKILCLKNLINYKRIC